MAARKTFIRDRDYKHEEVNFDCRYASSTARPAGTETHTVLWEGLMEQAEATLAHERAGLMCPNARGGTCGTRGEWTGRYDITSFKSACEAATKVWKPGLLAIEQMREELAKVELPSPVDRRRRKIWNEEEGSEFSLDRWRSGSAFWESTARRKMNGPQVITIAVNTVCSGSVRHTELLWRGAAAIAMIEVLEQKGYQTEFLILNMLGSLTEFHYDNLVMGTWVKRAGDTLDVANVANAVSAWYMRTIGFGSWSAAIPGRNRMTGGMGQVVNTTEDMIPLLDPEVDPRGICLMRDVLGKLEAIKEATRHLTRIVDLQKAA
jgi:hypothetical protein